MSKTANELKIITDRVLIERENKYNESIDIAILDTIDKLEANAPNIAQLGYYSTSSNNINVFDYLKDSNRKVLYNDKEKLKQWNEKVIQGIEEHFIPLGFKVEINKTIGLNDYLESIRFTINWEGEK